MKKKKSKAKSLLHYKTIVPTDIRGGVDPMVKVPSEAEVASGEVGKR
jgi:hypothetical protein